MPRPIGLTPERIAQARRLWEDGNNRATVARLIGVAHGTIEYYRKRDGWPERPNHYRHDLGKVRLAEKLWNEAVPALDIAAVLGVRRSTVLGWRKRYCWRHRISGQSEPTWEACYRARVTSAACA